MANCLGIFRRAIVFDNGLPTEKELKSYIKEFRTMPCVVCGNKIPVPEDKIINLTNTYDYEDGHCESIYFRLCDKHGDISNVELEKSVNRYLRKINSEWSIELKTDNQES